MWRDRTNLFISYRQSYSHHPSKKPKFASNGFGDSLPALSDERRGLMSAGAYEDDNGDAVIEMDLLPPRWLDVQDEVTENLAQVAIETRKLDQLHQKHVLPGFDDEHVKRKEEREIERLTQLITRKFQECQKAIKSIDVMVQETRDRGGINRAEETMAKNLKVSLASRVGEASALFRKKQSAYLKKLRALGGLGSPGPGTSTPVQNPFTDPSMMESETDRSFSQSTLQQTAQKRLYNDNEGAIAQREKEIDEIAQGIIELANIFQELQTMVIDQGTLLDRIDYNVEKMSTEVKAAAEELTIASGYQRRSLKRKIMLLLIIAIAGLFILLGLKLSSRSSTPPPPSPPVPPANGQDSPAQFMIRRRPPRIKEKREAFFLPKRGWRRRKRRLLDQVI